MKLTRLRNAVGLVGLAFASATPSAFAHAHPTGMAPVPDSTVASPATVTMTFSEAVEPKFSSIHVTSEAGKPFGKAVSKPVPDDPKTLTLALPTLPAGTYIVHWISVATDGHRMQGEYTFKVK